MLLLSESGQPASTSAPTPRLRFTKLQATGNDFILLSDATHALALPPALVSSLCDRRFGIGADGVIRAVKSAHIPEGAPCLAEDPAAEWFMDYINGDGTTAEMCGNGVRAFVRYLVYAGLAAVPVGGRIAVGTRAGVRWVDRLPGEGKADGGFRIDMGRWRVTGRPRVSAEGITPREGLGINLGNPHVVVPVSAGELAALKLGSAPVLEPAPADGANVEFVVTEGGGDGRLRMRVSERGVGETLSCGTGSVAATLAVRYWANDGATPEGRWEIDVPGGVVAVAMEAGEGREIVTLAGPAEVVFDGEFVLPRV